MFIAPNLPINDGTGSFSDAADCGCDLEMFGMGATASDFNNDGFVDLNITDLALRPSWAWATWTLLTRQRPPVT